MYGHNTRNIPKKIQRIVLIEPKCRLGHVYSLVKMPRIGLPLLGTQLENEGFDVDLYMGRTDNLPWDRIVQADLVGISLTTSTSREGYIMAEYLRSQKVFVVIGGIHPTFLPEESIDYADYVLRGEADFSFLTLIQALVEDKPLSNIPGLSYRDDNNTVIHNPLSEEIINVEELPIPDFSLFRLGKPDAIPIMTSRGCPYNCTFCSVTKMFGHRYRFRSRDLVLKELSRYNGKEVFFCDDNFTADGPRSKELLRAMLKEKISLKKWYSQVRVEASRDDELLQLMKKTNADTVFIGLESINPKTLKAYNKKQTVEDIKDCIQRFHKHKIKVHGMFVLGSDDDTVETVRQTVDFALESRVDSVQFLILTPLPGTPLFEKLEKEGRILTKDWELYDGHHVVYQPARMSAETLQYEVTKAFQRFYRARNIFQNVFLTGSYSAIYRMMGWWLTRKFIIQSQGYKKELAFKLKSDTGYLPKLYQKINDLKGGIMELKSGDHPLKICISEQRGVLYVKIQGVVNSLNLKNLKRSCQKLLPKKGFHVVISTEDLRITSEKAGEKLAKMFFYFNKRVRRLQLILPGKAEESQQIHKYFSLIPALEIINPHE